MVVLVEDSFLLHSLCILYILLNWACLYNTFSEMLDVPHLSSTPSRDDDAS